MLPCQLSSLVQMIITAMLLSMFFPKCLEELVEVGKLVSENWCLRKRFGVMLFYYVVKSWWLSFSNVFFYLGKIYKTFGYINLLTNEPNLKKCKLI